MRDKYVTPKPERKGTQVVQPDSAIEVNVGDIFGIWVGASYPVVMLNKVNTKALG